MSELDSDDRTQEARPNPISLEQELMDGFNPRVYIEAFFTPPPCSVKDLGLNILKDSPAMAATGLTMVGLTAMQEGRVYNSAIFMLVWSSILVLGIAAGKTTSWFTRRYAPFFRD